MEPSQRATVLTDVVKRIGVVLVFKNAVLSWLTPAFCVSAIRTFTLILLSHFLFLQISIFIPSYSVEAQSKKTANSRACRVKKSGQVIFRVGNDRCRRTETEVPLYLLGEAGPGGPQGPQGIQGEQGLQGIQGPHIEPQPDQFA